MPSMTDTDMGAAMKRAGFDTGSRLHAIASHCLAEDGGDMARASKTLWQELLRDEELRTSAMVAILNAVGADMLGMSGKGHSINADVGQVAIAPPRQQNGDGAGHSIIAEDGHLEHVRPSPTERETGANHGVPKGHKGSAPARGPSAAAIKAAGRVAKKASQTVLDNFRITMRQGSMESIGDIRISRYPSLLRQLGKRTWVSSREFHLVYLLRMAASKYPQMPDTHTTRDVFTVIEVEEMIQAAAELAAPLIGREKADA